MDMITVGGTVDENGYLTLDEPLKLPPGKVTVVIRSESITLEEAKKWQQERPDLSETQWQAIEAAYLTKFPQLEDTELPPDLADNLDHYLYRNYVS